MVYSQISKYMNQVLATCYQGEAATIEPGLAWVPTLRKGVGAGVAVSL